MSLPPDIYFEPVSAGGTGDMSGTAEIRFGILPTLHLQRVSLHLSAPADSGAARAQTFSVYGSDDPRALSDKQNGTTNAEWVKLTLPAASVHVDAAATGFSITLPDDDLALDNTIGKCLINVERPPAYIELRMAASGTASTGAGATDDDLSGWHSGY